MEWVTCPGSGSASGTCNGSVSTRCCCRRSTVRRWPTSGMTLPTTRRSTRCSALCTTSIDFWPRHIARGCAYCWTSFSTTRRTDIPGLPPRGQGVRIRSAIGTFGAILLPMVVRPTTGRASSVAQHGRSTRSPASTTYTPSFRASELNWRNTEVEQAMLDVLRFWIDRGVDGFRIDAAEHVLKDPELRDNPPATEDPDGPQLHIHDRGHPDNHALYRRIRRLLDSVPDGPRLALAEIVVEPVPDRLAYWAFRILCRFWPPIRSHFLSSGHCDQEIRHARSEQSLRIRPSRRLSCRRRRDIASLFAHLDTPRGDEIHAIVGSSSECSCCWQGPRGR